MVRTLFFLLAFSGSSQEEGTSGSLTVVPREIPGDPKPLLAVEGSIDVPNGARLDLKLYYGIFHPGMEMGDAATEVRDGKYAYAFKRFATEHTTFPDRNMAGTYLFRVIFEPGLQRFRELQKLPRMEVRKKFKIGTAAQMRSDKQKVKNRMIDQARQIAALSEEIIKTAREKPEELGTGTWDRKVKEWTRRGLDIERIAVSVPEYRALKIQALTGNLETLRDFNFQLAYFIVKRNTGAMRQGRAAIVQTVQDFKRRLAYEPLTREQTLGLALKAETILKSSADLSGDALDDARRNFIEVVMAIGSAEPARAHGPRVAKIVQSTRPYFTAMEEKGADAPGLRTALSEALAALIEILKKEEPIPEEE